MTQVTVGTKNQIVIPKEVRESIEGLKSGVKVSIYPLDQDSFIVKVNKVGWVSRTYGKLKGQLKSIDALKAINKMREEW